MPATAPVVIAVTRPDPLVGEADADGAWFAATVPATLEEVAWDAGEEVEVAAPARVEVVMEEELCDAAAEAVPTRLGRVSVQKVENPVESQECENLQRRGKSVRRERTGSFGGPGRAVRRRAARERSEDVRSACADSNGRRVRRRGIRGTGLTSRITDQPGGFAVAEKGRRQTHLQGRDPAGARRSRVPVRDIVGDVRGEGHQALHFREATIAAAATAAAEVLPPIKRVCLNERGCRVAQVSNRQVLQYSAPHWTYRPMLRLRRLRRRAGPFYTKRETREKQRV